MDKEPGKHRPIQVWLVIVIGSLAFSGFLMSNPAVTGFLAYDTGPEVNLNPDLLSSEDYYSDLWTAVLFAFALIALQVGAYMTITRFYQKLEEPE